MNSKMYNSAMWRSVSTQEAYEVNGGGDPDWKRANLHGLNGMNNYCDWFEKEAPIDVALEDLGKVKIEPLRP